MKRNKIIAISGKTVELVVKPEDYLKKLVEFSMIKVISFVQIEENKEMHNSDRSFKFVNPKLKVTLGQTPVKAGQKVTLTIAFRNPLFLRLTECKINVEGRSYGPKEITVDSIAARAEFAHRLELTLKRPGKESLNVNFDSKELKNLLGKLDVDVV